MPSTIASGDPYHFFTKGDLQGSPAHLAGMRYWRGDKDARVFLTAGVKDSKHTVRTAAMRP